MATGRHPLKIRPAENSELIALEAWRTAPPGTTSLSLSLRRSIFSPPYLTSSHFITVTFLLPATPYLIDPLPTSRSDRKKARRQK